MQRRTTLIAKLRIGRIGVGAEGALGRGHGQHLDGKTTRAAIGLGKVRYLSEVDDEDLAYAEMPEL